MHLFGDNNTLVLASMCYYHQKATLDSINHWNSAFNLPSGCTDTAYGGDTNCAECTAIALDLVACTACKDGYGEYVDEGTLEACVSKYRFECGVEC